jgi:hypothetical protein
MLTMLIKFVKQYGALVEVESCTGVKRRITGNERDLQELIDRANRFRLEGRWRGKRDFISIIENRLKPANVFQVPLPPLDTVYEALPI